MKTATAVFLTFLAAGLHVYRFLHAGALWRDEAAAVQLATLPTLGEVFERFPHEAFPMLFPLALRVWVMVTGGSDLALRLLGLIAGLSILGALWLNARQAGTVPLVSVALLGFHPFFLVYGDSVRGYGLGTLAILLAFGAYARLVDRPDRRSIVLAAVAAVASVHLLFHNSALLLGLGLAAAAVGAIRKSWRTVAAALGVGLLAALTLLPYWGPLSAARSWNVVVQEKIGPAAILEAAGNTLGQPALWALFLVAGLAVALARRDALFPLLAIPAVLAAQYGLFLVLGYSPRIWYFLPLMAVVASALDRLLAAPVRLVRIGVPIAAALVAILLLPGAYTGARVRMTNVDWTVRALEAQARPGDLIVVNPWFAGISFARYYQGPARWMTLPDLPDHRMHRYDLLMERMRSDAPIADVLDAVRRTLASGGRVWVAGSFQAPPPGKQPPRLGPAPGGSPWGWQDEPYSVSWSMQLGAFLRDRAVRGGEIGIPGPGPVSDFERLRLHVFEGWSEAQRPRPGISSR
ncbi:MAG: glycosyltransferase family 39 protein [Acidobacteriota bacterium]